MKTKLPTIIVPCDVYKDKIRETIKSPFKVYKFVDFNLDPPIRFAVTKQANKNGKPTHKKGCFVLTEVTSGEAVKKQAQPTIEEAIKVGVAYANEHTLTHIQRCIGECEKLNNL